MEKLSYGKKYLADLNKFRQDPSYYIEKNQLVEKIKAGDTYSLDLLVDGVKKPLYSFIKTILPNQSLQIMTFCLIAKNN